MEWNHMGQSNRSERATLMGIHVTVKATRGKMAREYESVKEAAHAFNCSANSIQFAAANHTRYQGWFFKIIRNHRSHCVDCGAELNDQKDDYCNKCWYEDLTGKSYMHQEKIGATQEPSILYQARGIE